MNKIYTLKFMRGVTSWGKPDYTDCEWEHCDDEYAWGPEADCFDDTRASMLEAAQAEDEPIKFRLEVWVEVPFGTENTAPVTYLYQGETVDDGAWFDTAENCLEYLAGEILAEGNQIVSSVAKYELAHVGEEQEHLPKSK